MRAKDETFNEIHVRYMTDVVNFDSGYRRLAGRRIYGIHLERSKPNSIFHPAEGYCSRPSRIFQFVLVLHRDILYNSTRLERRNVLAATYSTLQYISETEPTLTEDWKWLVDEWRSSNLIRNRYI